METLISSSVLLLLPVVLALTQFAKLYIPNKYAPIAALAFGIAGACLFPAASIALTIVSGIILGLTACGLYSGVKAVAE